MASAAAAAKAGDSIELPIRCPPMQAPLGNDRGGHIERKLFSIKFRLDLPAYNRINRPGMHFYKYAPIDGCTLMAKAEAST